MRVLRGFPAQGVVACYTEAAGGGDIEDFDAPRNAPAKTPAAHMEKIAFHSDFVPYHLALPIQSVPVSLPAVAASTATWAAPPLLPGMPSRLSYSVTGQQLSGAVNAYAHNLGYVPLVMVAYAGNVIVAGRIAQSFGAGRRMISVYATTSHVVLNWCGYSSSVDLPAISITVQVLVFRTPSADPAKALFSGNPAGFQIGRGKIESTGSYLRYRSADETSTDFDLARTVGLGNGGVRISTGGDVTQDDFYSGSFAGGPFIPVGT